MKLTSFITTVDHELTPELFLAPTDTILVPTFELYNQVQGELLLNGLTAKVICIPPPSVYEEKDFGYYVTDDKHTAYFRTKKVGGNTEFFFGAK